MQVSVLLRFAIQASVIGLAGFLVLFGAGVRAEAHSVAGAEGDRPTITIGYVDWTEAVAVSHLMQAILENRFHYRVALQLVNLQQAFAGVASGQIDAFLDVWLPETHVNHWQKYRSRVVDLGPWYQGRATLGLAVPRYVAAHGISDLKARADRFNHEIVGIRAGAGLMRITQGQVIPAYHLGSYTLRAGSSEELVDAVDAAIAAREAIVFTAWKPHWLFRAYPIRYLQDPMNVYHQADRIHVIVRQGLATAAPQAGKLLDAFTMSAAQLTSLELTIANSRSAWGGVRRWLAIHQKVIAPWISAAATDRRDYLR